MTEPISTPSPTSKAPDSKRPTTSTSGWIQWVRVPLGLKPHPPVAVDCHGSEPDCGEPCHNRPLWVIEDAEGYYPTCLTHSGKVLNELLVGKYVSDSEVSLYFHAYKGT